MDFNSKRTGEEVEAILDSVSGKQDALVSGTNIKTVNGQSLLGSGNIFIEGGSGGGGGGYSGANVQAVDTGEEVDGIEGDVNIKYTPQSLTEGQKLQARTNIGAASQEYVTNAINNAIILALNTEV